MARRKRFIQAGYCYHVMLRGIGGRSIFNDDKDRARFCILMQYASEIGKFNIHGFCLMGNHVHLLLQPHTDDLSSGMHRLTFRYAQYYNKKVNRQGYVFQNRYRAIVVEHGDYLRRLIRYIHRNPVRANLVEDLSDYRWSSHQAYLGNSDFTWLKKDTIISLFGPNCPASSVDLLNQYVYLDNAEAKIELEEIRNSIGIGAYGSSHFVEEFLKAFEPDSNELIVNKICGQSEKILEIENQMNLECLVNSLTTVTGISLEQIQSTCKDRQIVDARSVFVSLVTRFKLYDTNDIADLLRRDPTSIVRLGQRTKQSTVLKQLADEIESNLLTEFGTSI